MIGCGQLKATDFFGKSDPYVITTVEDGSGPKGEAKTLVAQCSGTPATVAATPPCSATPFQTQISVRHLPGHAGEGKVRHQNF